MKLYILSVHAFPSNQTHDLDIGGTMFSKPSIKNSFKGNYIFQKREYMPTAVIVS